MPVPKGKRDLYGKIVGHLQNIGIGREEAKDKADSAVAKAKPAKSKGRKRARVSKAGY
jgi:hypothetical protein